MRHPLNRSLLCLALLLPMAAGHAQSQEAAAPAATEAPEAAPAPAPAASDSLIGAPSEGMGQIVFFREKKFAGAAVKYKVREGETELGKLSSGTYFVASVAPGTHQYTVHSEAKDVLTLEVEAG